MISALIASLRHLLGWLVSAFGPRADLILENFALRQQLLALHAKRPRRRLSPPHKLFLGCLKKALVRMETASRRGHTENSCWLASGWLSAVLEMALKS